MEEKEEGEKKREERQKKKKKKIKEGSISIISIRPKSMAYWQKISIYFI